MSREALVIGINRYPLLKDKVGGKSRHLMKPAADAEAIAQVLEELGNFRVQRFPAVHRDGTWEVDPNPKTRKLPQAKQLKKAIVQLFNPPTSVPDTVLLFFAGHGLLDESGGVREGFLAASDTNPGKNNWGISLYWLRQLLQESPVRQQIIWLDCCHSGALLNFTDADPGVAGKGRDRCFITAARDFEVAYEQLGQAHGVLTSALLPGLNPTNHSSSWVTNYSLVDYINNLLEHERQRPLFHNTGGEILLTGEREKIKQAVLMAGVCPYKGLESFDFNSEDAQYFYGRTALTDELLERVRRSNFLAVMGASGSGKSSLVKAGLLYQLQLGKRLGGSENWRLAIFRPGKRPLSNLAQVFTADSISLLAKGAQGLVELINKVKESRLVLVVDQFEEVFTLTQDEMERERFFQCLLESLELTKDKFCLILTMRANFFGKCAERKYSGLAKKIQDNFIPVTSMTDEELVEAITKPAQKVGLEVERELVQVMLDDVHTPACLPLLQYTLTELWRNRQVNRLTLAEYAKLGRMNGSLRRRADEVYEELTPSEQRLAKQVFLNLTQLGEGTEDTKRQVLKEDLVNEQQSVQLVDSLLQKLVAARLVIISELQGRGSEGQETLTAVEVAHEALIRHWPQLQSWIRENREAIRVERKIEAGAEEWSRNARTESYLLTGARLLEAENYLQDYKELGLLSSLGQEFIARSRQRQRRNHLVKLTIGAAFVGVLAIATVVSTGFAIVAQRARQEAERAMLIERAVGVENLTDTEPVEGLAEAIVLAEESEKKFGQILGEVYHSLFTAVQVNREKDRFIGHETGVMSVAMAPTGDYIASGGRDGTIRLWDLDGKQLNESWVGGEEGISAVAIAPEGDYIASGGEDNKVQLWDRKGNSKVLGEHEDDVLAVAFSPDGRYLVSGSKDKTIRLWTREGNPVGKPFTGHTDYVPAVTFTPDGQSIISGSWDNTIRFWDLQGNQRGKTLEGHDDFVLAIAVSPDGKYIVSGGGDQTLRLWDRSGKAVGKPFQGHEAYVSTVAFSRDGKHIFSASLDRTVRWWDLDGDQIGPPLVGHEGWITTIAVTPSNDIISASDDGTLRLWKLEGHFIGPSFVGHQGPVRGVAFSPDGKYIVSGSEDRTLRLWDKDGQPIGKPFLGHQGVVHGVAFSPDGEYIVSSSEDKTLRLWDKNGQPIGKPFVGHRRAVHGVAFSPDGEYIVSSSEDKTLRLWDKNGQPIGKPFVGHRRAVYGVAFSPDGEYIVSGSRDNTLRLWDKDGQPIGKPFLGHHRAVYGVAFSPDGEYIVSASADSTLRLWTREGNQVRHTFEGHKDIVTQVAFGQSEEWTYIVSGSWDKTLRLWTLEGEPIGKPFTRHENAVNAIAVSADGKHIISGSEDHTLQEWKLENWRDLLTIGCNQLRSHPMLFHLSVHSEIKENAMARQVCQERVW